MENASKALIIAGAILLSILIISLGIMIFRQASGVVDSNAMDEVAVSSFNQKFTQYEGENIRGANVNALINTVVQNNLSNSGDESKQVKVTVSAEKWTGTKPNSTVIKSKNDSGSAQTGKSYKVSCTPDSQSGYITEVTIEDAGSTDNP